ncbi:hypothetical protein JKP88DRAFT_347154 [Tribonema minus]|uniref:Uncharacterized protein n=1 Tax=Tribonema minus TaxID=303371 RepID=A0A835YU34_9STRA|nr:hypothetical protein JKP88DRAFT_347154 [Tribonema minus]
MPSTQLAHVCAQDPQKAKDLERSQRQPQYKAIRGVGRHLVAVMFMVSLEVELAGVQMAVDFHVSDKVEPQFLISWEVLTRMRLDILGSKNPVLVQHPDKPDKAAKALSPQDVDRIRDSWRSANQAQEPKVCRYEFGSLPAELLQEIPLAEGEPGPKFVLGNGAAPVQERVEAPIDLDNLADERIISVEQLPPEGWELDVVCASAEASSDAERESVESDSDLVTGADYTSEAVWRRIDEVDPDMVLLGTTVNGVHALQAAHAAEYHILSFLLAGEDVGFPNLRKRVFFLMVRGDEVVVDALRRVAGSLEAVKHRRGSLQSVLAKGSGQILLAPVMSFILRTLRTEPALFDRQHQRARIEPRMLEDGIFVQTLGPYDLPDDHPSAGRAVGPLVMSSLLDNMPVLRMLKNMQGRAMGTGYNNSRESGAQPPAGAAAAASSDAEGAQTQGSDSDAAADSEDDTDGKYHCLLHRRLRKLNCRICTRGCYNGDNSASQPYPKK